MKAMLLNLISNTSTREVPDYYNCNGKFLPHHHRDSRPTLQRAFQMSVVGIDLGNEGVVVAQVNRGGVSTVLNENTGRRTPYVPLRRLFISLPPPRLALAVRGAVGPNLTRRSCLPLLRSAAPPAQAADRL